MKPIVQSEKEAFGLIQKNPLEICAITLVAILYYWLGDLFQNTGRILISFLFSVILISAYRFYIKVFCGEVKVEYFTDGLKFFAKDLVLVAYKDIIICLWTILFVVPGLYKALCYYFAECLQAENPNIPLTDCLKLSQKLIDGHKGDIFLFILSFLILLFLFGLIVVFSEIFGVIYYVVEVGCAILLAAMYFLSKTNLYLSLKEDALNNHVFTDEELEKLGFSKIECMTPQPEAENAYLQKMDTLQQPIAEETEELEELEEDIWEEETDEIREEAERLEKQYSLEQTKEEDL